MHPNLRAASGSLVSPITFKPSPRLLTLRGSAMRAARSIHASAALSPRHTGGALRRIPSLSPMIALNSLRCIATTALAPGAMFSHPPPEPGADFNVVMVGAGNIMFGSDEGPWNHSFRFEHKLGPRLKVTALIDPSVERAQSVLEGKRASFVESAYRNTKVFRTIEDYHADLKANNITNPDSIVVGCPPAYRGGTTKGTDLELTLSNKRKA